MTSYQGEESLIVAGGILGEGIEVWALNLEKQDSIWQLLPLLPTRRSTRLVFEKLRNKERKRRKSERKREKERES